MKSGRLAAKPNVTLSVRANPRFSIDEDDIPPEFSPQILLDGDFSQYVETTKPVESLATAENRSDNPPKQCESASKPCNAPIDDKRPCSSSFFANDDNPSLLIPSTSKDSPFTRFLLSSTPPSKKQHSPKTGAQVSVTNSSVALHSSPQDTEDQRLERLLAEAAEEARDKILQQYHETVTGNSPPAMASHQDELETKEEVPSPKKPLVRQIEESDDTSSDSSGSSDLSSAEELEVPKEKPIKKPRHTQRDEGAPPGKRAKPRHTLVGWMYHKYPILKYFVTAPTDAARYPHKYRCRVCLVELSLMTKGPLEILGHYRTDAHLVKEHRIRMETPGLPLYDKHCNELTGRALKYAKDRAKREYPVAPRLGDYYLRVGQLEQPEGASASPRSKEVLSQLNLLKFGLVHGGHLDTVIALWHDLVRETKAIEPISQYDWRPHRVLVSKFPIVSMFRTFLQYSTLFFCI